MDVLLKYGLCALIIFIIVKWVRWFLDPYLLYIRRSSDKGCELYIGGQKTHTNGIPYLLRQEAKESSIYVSGTTISIGDLYDLTLVVPCYNEENRLPQMLEEHIEYIKRLQKQNRLPKLIEIILVDDGSKDKTLQYIKRMSE